MRAILQENGWIGIWAACLMHLAPAAWAHGLIRNAQAQVQTQPAPATGQAPAQDQAGPHTQTPANVLSLNAPPGPPNFDTGSVMFVGNATVIIRYGGLTILTDPNFLHKGDHVHLGYGLTAERLTDPALTLDNLPPIDLVVLSHMHGDHFDQLVQEKLDRTVPIVTTPQAAAALADMKFQSRYPLTTWQTLTVRKGDATLRITAMPARHGPPVVSKMMPETMGSMLEFSGQEGRVDYRMYISGDTLVFNDIRDIPKRYPDIDLALLHLGGTKIMDTVLVTMDGKQGADMLRIIAPHKAIPIHYNDYDVFKSPIEDFTHEVKAAELQDKVIYLQHGESYNFQGRYRQPAATDTTNPLPSR